MGNSIYITGVPASGDPTPEDAAALHAGLAKYLPALQWAVEHFDSDPGHTLGGDEWSTATKIGYDLDTLDLQLAQIIALARVASVLKPDWTFEITDDLDILEGDGDEPMAVKNGQFISGADDAEGYIKDHLTYELDGTFHPKSEDDEEFEFEIDTTYLYDHSDNAGPSPSPQAAGTARTWSHTPLHITERLDAEPQPHQASVSAYSVETKDPDDDGEIKVIVAAIVFNALAESAEVGIDVDLFHPDGGYIATASAEEDGPFHEGEKVSFGGRLWLDARGTPEGATIGLRAWRTETQTLAVGACTPAFKAPDRDGDVRFELTLELHNDGPAWDEAKATLFWLDEQGERTDDRDRETLGAVPRGLSTHPIYGYLREDDQYKVGRDVFVEVTVKRRHTTTVVQGSLPRLHLAGTPERVETRPPDRPEPAATEPMSKAPPAPAEAPAAAPSTPPDIDTLLGGSASDILTALQHIRSEVQKRYATRVRGLLQHAEPTVRAESARCLAAIGGASLVIPLRALLQDADEDVRSAAQAAIATLQPQGR